LKFYNEVPEQSENLFAYSDPEIFNKILTQLLNNAIKFTEKGSITIGFEKDDDKLEFFVKDTGIGIGKDSLENIFDRFVKLDMNQTAHTEGSGLGLSIVKGMINIIGGDIRVKSEMEVGSEFIFSIPFTNSKVIASSVASGKEQKRSLSQSLILIAEDDETNYFYLHTLITQETGEKIIHAANGKEAIDLFKANPDINLILMDIKMPEIDGFEATRQIKQLNRDVHIIAITAYAMSGDEERIISAGFDGYLSKPISKKSLLEKIGEFIMI
jgi:CheY-like chemotaxis protein